MNTSHAEEVEQAVALADAGRVEEAIERLRAISELDVDALTELGLLLHRGSGAQRTEGRELLERAADNGSNRAARALGRQSQDGAAPSWMQHVAAAEQHGQQLGNDWQGNISRVEDVPSQTSSPAHPEAALQPSTAETAAGAASSVSESAPMLEPESDSHAMDTAAGGRTAPYVCAVHASDFASLTELRSRAFDVVTAEQPVSLSRVARVLLHGTRRTNDKGRARHAQVIAALTEMVDQRDLDCIHESEDGSLEAAIVMLPGWRSFEARELGPRVPTEMPLVELVLHVRAARTDFPAMTKPSVQDHVYRTVLGMARVDRAMIARFARAWISDVGEWQDGSPVDVEDAEADASPVTTETPPDSVSNDDAAFAAALQSGDALAIAAHAMTMRDDLERGMGLRAAALRGELLAVECLLSDAVPRGVAGFDDKSHWAIVGADHGIQSALVVALERQRDDGAHAQPVAAAAWLALARLRARAKNPNASTAPVDLDDESRAYLAKVLAKHRSENLRRRGLPELARLRSEWDWRGWERVRDVAQRLDRGGDLVRYRDLTADLNSIANVSIQIAEHLWHFGLEMVPDPRYELVPPTESGFVHVQPRGERPASSNAYRAAAVTVRIAIGTAAVDEAIRPEERDAIVEHIEAHPGLTDAERNRLGRYAEALLAYPPDPTEDIARLAVKLDASERSSLLDLIADVIAADGVLHPAEHRLLDHVAHELELQDGILLDVERRLDRRSAASIATAGQGEPRLSVPGDMSVESYPGLDPSLSVVLDQLRVQPKWSRWHLEIIANASAVNVDEAIARINAWSGEVLGRACITAAWGTDSDVFELDLALLEVLDAA